MVAADYTARIDPQALKVAGITDVFRYLCFSPVGDWKTIGKPEYNELINSGIGVTLNWEFDARDWLSSSGRTHGTTAVIQAKALGYPAGCTIYGSCDFDMNRSEWLASGRNYCEQFAQAIRDGGYRPGVYGPYNVLTWVRDNGAMDRYWQAGMSTAWSGGLNAGLWKGAHVRQRRHQTIGGRDVDINDVLIPEWGQARKDMAMATGFDGWGEIGPPNADPYFTAKGGNGGLLRGMLTLLADLKGEILDGHSPYDMKTPKWMASQLIAIRSGIDALNARTNTVALAPEDRDLLNRAVTALENSSPINDADRQAITALTAVLTELASHLK